MLPGKGKSDSHGARPVHHIILMIEWIRTSRLSIENSLSQYLEPFGSAKSHFGPTVKSIRVRHPPGLYGRHMRRALWRS